MPGRPSRLNYLAVCERRPQASLVRVMPPACNALHSRASGYAGGRAENTLSRQEGGEAQLDPHAEQQAPPGQFISDEHEADCSRFLEEVKEFVRRRHEAGLGRER
jgi:hypothetical protein